MSPETLHESILEFLKSSKVSRRSGGTHCACGSTITRQNTTFFYDGQSWKVILPVCLKCHPTPRAPISYDA